MVEAFGFRGPAVRATRDLALPGPGGPLPARLAVAAQYRRWNAAPDPDRIMLTASTSEAYSFLFRLLCNPGDAVLVPSPSLDSKSMWPPWPISPTSTSSA